MAAQPTNPAIGDKYVTDDGEPREFFAPGRWDTDYEALIGGQLVAATGILSNVFAAYRAYLEASSGENKILWLAHPQEIWNEAKILADWGAPPPTLGVTLDGALIGAQVLTPGTVYLIKTLGANGALQFEEFLDVPTPLTGPAVERVVAVKNPGFGTILGDFNFMMSQGGNRSLQLRTVSGTVAYTDFNTYWSAGAGGANDVPASGNWDETWRYAEASFVLTAHNHYQHVEFIANGWFYHVHMVVGPGFNTNRFTLTRWRLEGVKGVKGDAGAEPGTKAVLITGTLGPGAGGTVNVPLVNDGKALFDVAMKLSNGASFSPPLDTDDGANRWWYDFDHTTGAIVVNRFGAFTGGAYRIVAYYA